MTTVYLVRHAHADWQPNENRPLSARGHSDAERLADRLGALPIGAIYSSTARRARETVAPLAFRKALPIHELHDLRERELSARPVDDFLSALKATWHDPSFAWPGGESNREAQQRGIRVIEQIRAWHPDEHVVAGTHGNLLALILQHYDSSVDFWFWQRLTMPDVYRLRFSTDREAAVERMWSG